jgi:hypothetical protein
LASFMILELSRKRGIVVSFMILELSCKWVLNARI